MFELIALAALCDRIPACQGMGKALVVEGFSPFRTECRHDNQVTVDAPLIIKPINTVPLNSIPCADQSCCICAKK
ncbi:MULTISPECIES: hypothetical protein [unclassified Paenibacillus]|uniref:hypothetical protein n=1 Tax=unclassified Paenibacillus TaxID=185978 RepID=UPI000A93FC78|nr:MULTISPECIES: hypothetical protein [unclassified Paenibacillus]